MSQYSRISQLQQRITELRMRGLEDRVEIRQLRNLVSEQKTALEAAQLEIEALKRELSVNEVSESEHKPFDWAVRSDMRLMQTENLGVTQDVRQIAECSDYRQYESLAVQEAFGRGMARYAGAMQKLAEND